MTQSGSRIRTSFSFSSSGQIIEDLARKFRTWANNHEKCHRVEDALRMKRKSLGLSRLDLGSFWPILQDLVPDYHFLPAQKNILDGCFKRTSLFNWEDAQAEQLIFTARCAQLLWYEEERIDGCLAAMFEHGSLVTQDDLEKVVENIAENRIPPDGSGEAAISYMMRSGSQDDIKIAIVVWLALATLDCHRTGPKRQASLPFNAEWDLKNRVWRKNELQERLVMESMLRWGLARLLNVGLLFCFFYQVLEAPSSLLERGNTDIRSILEKSFSLHTVKSIATLDDLKDYLREVSNAVDIFSPLSGNYFGSDMSVKLIDSYEYFADEQSRSGRIGDRSSLLDLPITTAFSFTAWVQIGRDGMAPVQGQNDRFILRKRASVPGWSKGPTCWGWKANGRLVFGAHDAGRWGGADSSRGEAGEALPFEFPLPEQSAAMLSGTGVEAWADLMPGNTEPRRAETSAKRTLLAVSVNGSSVEFFVGGGARLPAAHGANLVASSSDFNGGVPLQLPRDITDCGFNAITFGDLDIGIGGLVYYPRTLSREDVQTILRQGTSDWEMGSNIRQDRFSRDPIQEVKAVMIEQSQSSDGTFIRQSRGRVVDQGDLIAVQSQSQAVNSRAFPQPGETLPGASRVLDNVTQLRPFSLIEDPLTVLRESDDAILARWDPSPPSSTVGSTYAAWVRHTDQGYLFSRALSPRSLLDMCWGFIMYRDKMEWWMNRMVYPSSGRETQTWKYSYVTEPFKWSGEHWRHVALVFDAPSNRTAFGGRPCGTNGPHCGIHIYLDGSELPGTFRDYTGDSSTAEDVVEDCPAREGSSILLLGHRPEAPPQWQWRGEAMQMRYYASNALTPAQLFDLAMRSTASWLAQSIRRPLATIREAGGCTFPEELLDSATWVDVLGNGCAWYQAEYRRKPSVCNNLHARRNCPIACGSSDVCFNPLAEARREGVSSTIWSRVMLLDPSYTNSGSTVCLRDNPDGSLQNQALWKELKPPDTEGDLAQPMQIDPTCSFNGSAVDAVADAYAVSQEFALHFWVRTVPTAPGKEAPPLRPEISFWRQVPRAWRSESEPVNGSVGGRLGFPRGKPHITFRTDSHMPGSVGPFHLAQFTGRNCSYRPVEEAAEVDFEIPRDEWVFLAIVRTRDHMLIGMANSKGVKEKHPIWDASGEGTGRDCAPGLFDAISVNQRMLLSPIVVASRALSIGELQAKYYAERPFMELQVGPRTVDTARLRYSHLRTVRRFTQRTMLLAPPILAQSLRPEAPCLGNLEESMLREIRQKAEETRCQPGFYSCPFFDKPDYQLFDCSDPRNPPPKEGGDSGACTADEEACYFGKRPNKNGDYTEFLRTITDHAFVTREGGLLTTGSFINERSQQVRLSLVFHSPEYGLTTLLEIQAYLNNVRVQAVYTVSHYYSIVKPADWSKYIAYQVCCQLHNLVLFVSSLGAAKELFLRTRCQRRRMKAGDHLKVIFSLYDAVVSLSIAGLAVMQVVLYAAARSRQEDIVNSLVSVRWGELESREANKNMVFNSMVNLQGHIGDLQRTNQLALFVLILLVLRGLTVTNCHPRVALLVKTAENAADDLGHFMLVFVPSMFLFACLGKWRFGEWNPDFRSIYSGLCTLWDSLLGPPGKMIMASDDVRITSTSTEFAFYCFFFFVVVFFFYVNFVLAIILAAYTKVVDEMERTPVEQTFHLDAMLAVRYIWCQLWHGWPGPSKLLEFVECLPLSDEYVSMDDMLPAFDDRSRTKASLDMFKWHYSWDFLEPSYEGDTSSGERDMMEVKRDVQDIKSVTHLTHSVLAAGYGDLTDGIMSRTGSKKPTTLSKSPTPLSALKTANSSSSHNLGAGSLAHAGSFGSQVLAAERSLFTTEGAGGKDVLMVDLMIDTTGVHPALVQELKDGYKSFKNLVDRVEADRKKVDKEAGDNSQDMPDVPDEQESCEIRLPLGATSTVARL